MRLLDKVKNMFTEEIEEEVEVPVKKEVMQVEIESPRASRTKDVEVAPKREIAREKESLKDLSFEASKQEETKEIIREIKKETKVPKPVDFDDKDFRELEKPKKKKKKQPVKKEIYGGNKPATQPEKKVFKPTPIISPVYGILDKNYQKDEIVHKSEKKSYSYNRPMTIDDVRKKAYGTLEDQLEDSLLKEEVTTTKYEVTGNTEVLEDLILDVKDQLGEIPKTKIENNLENIEDELNDLEGTLVEISKRPIKPTKSNDDKELNLGETEENMIEDELNKLTDDDAVNENDLFDLIDSMYEKKDDE